MTFYKLALIWTISIHNIDISTSFVASSTNPIPKFSTQQSPIVRPNRNGSSGIPALTITTVSASPVSFISLEKCDSPSSNLSSEQRSTILNEALSSNSTAALMLLREINDVGDNGSVEDQLLDLVDGSSDSDDNGESGDALPIWTKVRILAKFSRRARRASLRRVLSSAECAIDSNDGGGRSRRRKALVLVLQHIAQSMLTNSDKAGSMKSGNSGGSGIAIWNIERDARRERKDGRHLSPNVFPGLEQIDFEEVYGSLEDHSAVDEQMKENVEEWTTSVPMDESPVLTDGTFRQKFEQDSKALTRTIEQKIDNIATERARVQAVKERNQQLEATREKKAAAAAAARVAEHARVQAIKDRHMQLEAERKREAAAKAAERMKLQLITNERNQRSLLISHLELDTKIDAKEKADRERKAASEAVAAVRAAEQARVQAINDRHRQLEAERKRESAAKAAEQVKLQLIANECSQRAILACRLELDIKLNAKKKADREMKAASAAATSARVTEHARVQAINDRHRQLEAERKRESAAKAAEQVKLQLIASECSQRAILACRLALDIKLNAKKKSDKEKKAASAASTAARAAEWARVKAINDRHQELEVKREREVAARANNQAKLQLIANERNQRSILRFRLELDAKLSVEKKAKKERELVTKAAAARATEQARDEEKALKKIEVAVVTRASKQASMQAAELAKKFL